MFSFFKKNLNPARLAPGISLSIKYALCAFFITDLFKVASATHCFTLKYYFYPVAFDSLKNEDSIYNATATACKIVPNDLDNCFFNISREILNFGEGYFGGHYCNLNILDTQLPATCVVDTLKANCPTGFGTTEDYLVTGVIAGAGIITLSSIPLLAWHCRKPRRVEAASTVQSQEEIPARPALKQRLRKIAPGSILELLVALGDTFAVYPFLKADLPWYFNPLLSSSISVLINFLLRIPSEKRAEQASLLIRSSIFFMIDFNTLSALRHEAGHVLAIYYLYKNPNPQIEISPQIIGADGQTQASRDAGLTALGVQLGYQTSDILIDFAGAAADTVSCAIALIVAQAIPNKYREIKWYLRMAACMAMFNSLAYAISTYFDSICDNYPGHDFCQLNQRELAPVVLAAGMLESLLLLQMLLSSCKMWRHRPENNANIQRPMVEETLLTINEERVTAVQPKLSADSRHFFHKKPSETRLADESNSNKRKYHSCPVLQ